MTNYRVRNRRTGVRVEVVYSRTHDVVDADEKYSSAQVEAAWAAFNAVVKSRKEA